MQADLVIVGAGMVGSTLALALAGSGLSILVVDAGALEVPQRLGQHPAYGSGLSNGGRRVRRGPAGGRP